MLIVIDQLCWLKRRDPKVRLPFPVIFRYSVSEGFRIGFGHRICLAWVAIKATLCRLSKFLIKYAAECHHYAKGSLLGLASLFFPYILWRLPHSAGLCNYTDSDWGRGTGGSRPRWQTANNICATFTSHVAVLPSWQSGSLAVRQPGSQGPCHSPSVTF